MLAEPIQNINMEYIVGQILRKGNCKMSQCLLLRNENGDIVLSDSAITEPFEDKWRLKSTKHPKVFVGKDCIWTHVGFIDYKEEIKKELDKSYIFLWVRLNKITDEFGNLWKQEHNFDLNYQLMVIQHKDSYMNSYLLNVNETEGIQCHKSEYQNTPLFQPIGLYSNEILNEFSLENIKNKDLKNLLTMSIDIVKSCIEKDKKLNNGVFVNGDVYTISMDTNGYIRTYINEVERKF